MLTICVYNAFSSALVSNENRTLCNLSSKTDSRMEKLFEAVPCVLR